MPIDQVMAISLFYLDSYWTSLDRVGEGQGLWVKIEEKK